MMSEQRLSQASSLTRVSLPASSLSSLSSTVMDEDILTTSESGSRDDEDESPRQWTSPEKAVKNPDGRAEKLPASMKQIFITRTIKASEATTPETVDDAESLSPISTTGCLSSASPASSQNDCKDESSHPKQRQQKNDVSAKLRWKALEENRMALNRQRVNLERKLFERDHVLVVELDPRHHSGGSQTPQAVVHSQDQFYRGQVKKGLRHGSGHNRWTRSGQEYTGNWKDGHRHGRGTHTWPNGRIVTGEWKLGHLEGHAHVRWPSGATYDGYCRKGRRHGRGTQTWPDGRVYVGDYQDGVEHGRGYLNEPQAQPDPLPRKYVGEFCRGARHGSGKQTWRNKMYHGEWQNNQMHGRGTLLWYGTGASYVGTFHRGKYHGHGCYHYATGRGTTKSYTGQFCHGAQQGLGRLLWTDGKVFEGSFNANKRHGFGIKTYSDGAIVYVGNWRLGKRYGLGIELDDVGHVVHCGLWTENRPVVAETAITAVQDDSNLNKRRTCWSEDSSSHNQPCRDDLALSLSAYSNAKVPSSC